MDDRVEKVQSDELLKQVVAIAREAGDAIMEVYRSDDFEVETKSEPGFDSPLTKADKAANDVIVAELQKISDYPIVSEENEVREVAGGKFWLVDPLDGTKEFIKRNGEFTVNIALINDERPVLGVVYAPDKGVLYFAADGQGAFKQTRDSEPREIRAVYEGAIPKVVASRSHRDERTEAFIRDLGEHTETSMGSSLKLCLVAEGAASVYPRFAPTSLWDTAAADAVVRAAGGTVEDVDGQPIRYNPNSILNPDFIVSVKEN